MNWNFDIFFFNFISNFTNIKIRKKKHEKRENIYLPNVFN